MWFTEDPWYPILGCILAALALFGMWRTTPRSIYLKGILACVVLGAAIYGLERMIVTQKEKIDGDVRDMVNSFLRQDLDRTLSHVSESANDERMLISGHIGVVDPDADLRITDMDVKLSDADHATARFRVNATVDVVGSRKRISTRWEFAFAREGNDWKVTRIQRMKILNDEYIEPTNMSEI